METDIKRNGFCSSMAGTKEVYYVSAENVSSMSRNNEKMDCVLASGAAWKKIETTDAVAQSPLSEGHCYDEVITMHVAGSSNNYGNILDAMVEDRFILRRVDYNGNSWLYGDKDTPLRLSWSQIEGSTPGEESGYELTFSAKTRTPPAMMV